MRNEASKSNKSETPACVGPTYPGPKEPWNADKLLSGWIFPAPSQRKNRDLPWQR